MIHYGKEDGEKIVGIMQPYYFPYEGYFSHIFNCELFILHNGTEYTKKGWINRNRILTHSGVVPFSMALENSPDKTLIGGKKISKSYDPHRQFRILEGAYRKSPFWSELKEILPDLLHVSGDSMFDHLERQINLLCQTLSIPTPITASSDYGSLAGYRGQDLVLEICKRTGAKTYLNPIGGKDLYTAGEFADNQLNLSFIDYSPNVYPQRPRDSASHSSGDFIERLSVLDGIAETGISATEARIKTNFSVIQG